MAAHSVIVSFDEARRNARASAVGRRVRSARTSEDAAATRSRDSQNLSNIFRLDFSDDAFDGAFGRASDGALGSALDGAPGSALGGAPGSAPARSASSAPRQAIFSAEDFADEEASAAKRSLFSGLAAKIGNAAAARSKRNAERAFEKSYGSAGASGASGAAAAGAGAGAGGSRAALYTGTMGASHKKAARLQERAGGFGGLGGFGGSGIFGGFSIPLPHIKLPEVSRRFRRNATAAMLVLATAILVSYIYTPAQQYYYQMRERDRLAAEYAAVQQRNDALQATVDRLSTEEGLEDKAHAEFGLIKADEETASVIGIKPVSHVDLKANIPPGSIAAPETWYSGFLDIFFLYDRG